MNIAVFLTRGYNLSFWKKNGTLKREFDYYKILEKKNYKITFVSYGSKFTDEFLIQNSNFKVLNKPNWMPLLLYSLALPFIHYKELKKIDIIKTNQIFGTLEAFFCSIFFSKPLYSRSGYVPSSKVSYLDLSFLYKLLIYTEEFVACKFSRTISVSSRHAINHLSKKYNTSKKKFLLLYNFVDPIFFSNNIQKKNFNKKQFKVCFVGRLVHSKQPMHLLKVIKNFHDISLHILGDGPLLSQLKKESVKLKNEIFFYKKIDNKKVFKFMRDKDILLFPTLEEGNSKVILEAMSSGLIVMTNNIDCNRELISHKNNGFLINNNNIDLYRKYLKHIIKDKKTQYRLSLKAYLFAKKMFSKKNFLKIELKQYKRCN